MSTQTSIIGYDTRTKDGWFYASVIAIALTASLGAGCGGGGGGGSSGTLTTLDDPNPVISVTGTTLYCDSDGLAEVDPDDTVITTAVVAPDSIPSYVVGKEPDSSEYRANAGNTIRRLGAAVTPAKPDGSAPDTLPAEPLVHPILVSYTEQIYCNQAALPAGQACYETGDGSADIGDPNHIDDAYVSASLDNGQSWKKYHVGDTALTNDNQVKSSIQVSWANQTIDYPGHSHKMTLAVQGNNILAAWLDKYCPSGNPYLLVDPTTEDLYKVNGTQGSISYDLPCTEPDPESLDYDCAPNGKPVYEVPFSCVWAARGVFDPATGLIEWRQQEQLTSGTRDANKIWIAAKDIGFAMVWQEDPEGLRAGKGAGPGVGWSGATTNHGADIWYTHILMSEFDDVLDASGNVVDGETFDFTTLTEKAKPGVKFTYPVRITDNAACAADGDTKLYCAQVCTGSNQVESNNKSGDTINRCITGDHDPLEDDPSIYTTLDGDTGASRPTITILKTMDDQGNLGEYITVLAYEETKGLSETEPGVPDDPTATDIAVEGKIVLAEAFLWNAPVTISAGNIVNVKVPRYDPATGTFDSNDMIYENARRVVLMKQVDPCEMTANSYPIGFLYKQSFETQGGPSDMFVRLARGFTPETFESVIYNVSSQSFIDAGQVSPVDVEDLTWSTDNLDDYVGENPYDNTFSPRGFLRGDEIYTGFAYTPDDARTVNLGVAGQIGSNFWIHRNLSGGPLGWLGPQQITFEKGGTTALDPRFVPTPKGMFNKTGLLSDQSNNDVLMITYGTADENHEIGVWYSRSVDKGETWEYVIAGGGGITTDPTVTGARFAKLSDWAHPVEEGSAQLMASPDGNMGFNIWLRESADPPDGVNNRLGLETDFGRVDWVTP